jgi:putative transcriptional regulator
MTRTETRAEAGARFKREMTETIDDLRAVGAMDETTYKRTMRDLKREHADEVIVPLTGPDIRAIREHAHVSQAYLAKFLNLTVDHVSKLERGAARPTGALLAILNVIRRKGLEAIM